MEGSRGPGPPLIKNLFFNWPNASADGLEEYYRRNIFIPFLDHVIDQMKIFIDQKKIWFGDEDNVPKQVRLQKLLSVT